MNSIINLLSKNIFFHNIPKEKIQYIINSDICTIKSFSPKMNIYEIGEKINHTGIILSGTVDIVQMSINGDETIINRLTEGHILGNSFSCVSEINNLNYIKSYTTTTILFIDVQKLLREFDSMCEYRLCLFENMIQLLAKSNIALNKKIQIVSQKTLRDKLITYFELLSMNKGSNEITIPFNREQLACYLGSERSSVCRELSKLKADSIINIKGNKVVLLYQTPSAI